MKIISLILMVFLIIQVANPQNATIEINVLENRKPISPYIYGRNNSLSDQNTRPLQASQWELFRDAGVHIFRENGGNNATKYNWRLKLSSHPDWYNNVYHHDWDFASLSLQENIPEAAALWAFQLIGYAASTNAANFDDSFNNWSWWPGVSQNLAGGGVRDANYTSTKALSEGDINLYLTEWNADSTTGIIDHWFGNGGLGLNTSKFRYWDMDNEPEIWSGTHDDVMPKQPSAEEFMQRYFAVAKKARTLFPGIKLMGPVPCNEWQWYFYNNKIVKVGNKNYPWLEFFIKRIAEEQEASGVRLLDIIDLHFYPDVSDAAGLTQVHRVFFDKSYDYPGANGVKGITGGWDNTIKNEYIFERCREWLDEYMGKDHGVTLSLSEMDINNNDPNLLIVWYASVMGTFANEGVEIFTPWSWKTGMWETLHLFSRYAKRFSVASVSSNEDSVSAYSSVNNNIDSLTVILVNRSINQSNNVCVNLNNFTVGNGTYNTLRLNNLPANETFISHTNNALQAGNIEVDNNSCIISLPPLSVTAVILTGSSNGEQVSGISKIQEISKPMFNCSCNQEGILNISYELLSVSVVEIELFDLTGRKIAVVEHGLNQQGTHTRDYNLSKLPDGVYFIVFNAGMYTVREKMLVMNR